MKHPELAVLVGLAAACGSREVPVAGAEPCSITRRWLAEEERADPAFQRRIPALEGCWFFVDGFDHRLVCLRRTGEELFELEYHRLAGHPVLVGFARSEATWDGAALVLGVPPDASLARLEPAEHGGAVVLEACASTGTRLAFARRADPVFAAEQREFEQREHAPRLAVKARHVAPPENWPARFFAPELGRLVVDGSGPCELRFLERRHRTRARWTGSALVLERPLMLDDGAVRRIHPVVCGDGVKMLTDVALARLRADQPIEPLTFRALPAAPWTMTGEVDVRPLPGILIPDEFIEY